jgi:hypothetical protein
LTLTLNANPTVVTVTLRWERPDLIMKSAAEAATQRNAKESDLMATG